MSTDKHPIVSVIIPVFNGAQYIRDAVESVLGQTFKDVEIIMVDDGSTDETFAVIESWIKDGTIRYLRQTNKGAPAARNAGIRLAKGEFLKFLDYDDFLYPQQLELQVNHLNNKPNTVISITDFEFEFESKTRKYMQIGLGKGSQLACIIQSNIGPLHGFLVRRSIIEKIGGFDEELSSYQDYDLWLRAVAQGCVVERVDYLGCRYRILSGSISSKSNKQLCNCCKVNEKLNQALLPQLQQLPDDAVEQLLWTNIKFIHRCFMQKIDPASHLPTALKVSRIIYAKKKDGFKRILLKIIGIRNIVLFQYIGAHLTDRDYDKKLSIIAWRNEQAQT